MVRYVLALVLIIAVVAVVMLSSDTGRSRADFTYINSYGINTLDPAQMSYHQDHIMAMALWEGLATLDPKTVQPIEGVAYLPPQISEDSKRYIFTLRPEAKWSNGDLVTARDFIRGWRRAIEPGTSETYYVLISSHVAGAQEYIQWRFEHVELLGLVRQLQNGSAIKDDSAEKVLQSEAGRKLSGLLGMGEQKDGAALLERCRQADVDWKEVGDAWLDEHIVEMEKQFAKVGMRAIDDHHIEFVLYRPIHYFIDLTAWSVFMPIHESIEILRESYEGRPLTDAGLWSYDPQWTKPDYHRRGYPGAVTNGAYRISEWDFKRRIRLVKNPYYWNTANVPSQTIEMLEGEYQNTGFMLYEQGAADMMTDMTMDYVPELYKQVKAGLRDDIHVIPSFGTYYYDFNCRPTYQDGSPNLLANVHLRRALTLAVNKQEIVEHVMRLDNPVSNTFIPAGQIPKYASPRGLQYNPEQARRELAAAGFPGGKGLPELELLYNTGYGHERVAQAVQRMWQQELGVKVALVGKEVKTFAEDKQKGRFMIGRSGWFGDYMDPTTFLDLMITGNGHNYPGFSDSHYDRLLQQAADELDNQRRMAILSEAEAYIMEEQLPILPLYTYVMVYAWRPEVEGIHPNPRTHFPLQNIWKRQNVEIKTGDRRQKTEDSHTQ